ncbi:MAG: hypothetical protein GY762_16925, partial [Proteobacteria bacterium]|nr:hypothetical protein [Pseudomonadota bacterium]
MIKRQTVIMLTKVLHVLLHLALVDLDKTVTDDLGHPFIAQADAQDLQCVFRRLTVR